MKKAVLLRKFFRNPEHTGTVAPSSTFLAKAVNAAVEELTPTKVIEIGGGTGAITEELASKDPIVIEKDADLCKILRGKFPYLKIHEGCGVKFLKTVDNEVGLVVTIPLINNPIKEMLVDELRRLYNKSLVKWCVLYTYGVKNPLLDVGFKFEKRAALVLRNIPPAFVWVYK